MKFLCRRARAQGLTMVELAVTAGILALLGATFFALLNNGLAMWGRSRVDPPFLDVSLFDDRLERDVENSFPFKDLSVRGDGASISFPSSACGELKGEEAGPCLGLVRYSFDPEAGTVVRTFRNMSDLFTGGAGRSRVVMTGVEAWSVSYDIFDVVRNEYVRTESWPSQDIPSKDPLWPLAIRIEQTFRRGSSNYDVTRTYEFPHAPSR